MFEHGFPKHWSTLKKLIYLKGAGIIGGASAIWKTLTGTLIHITDALASPMQKCEVMLEPIQDLHGQDAPYPAGGGKNKLDWSKVSVTSSTHYGMQFTKGSQEGTITVSGTLTASGGAVAPISYDDYSLSGKGYVFLTEKISGDNVVELNRTYGFRTESEKDIAIYMSGEVGETYTETIRISVYAPPAPSSWSPFENICPITGWTGCEVTRTGKNLFDGEIENGALNPANGENTPNSERYRSKNYIPVSPNTAYKLSVDGVAQSANIYSYGADKSYLSDVARPYASSFTTSANTHFIRFFGTSAINSNKVQFELGSSATDYEAPNITTLSVTFPDGQTVYKGTFNFTTGKLTLTHGYFTDNGSLNWQYTTSGGARYYAGGVVPGAENISLDGASNYGVMRNNFLHDGIVVGSNGRVNLCGSVASAFATVDALKYALSDNPIQIVYKLDTPTEISLTPQEISTLKGVNNVWSNSNGDTTIIYKA